MRFERFSVAFLTLTLFLTPLFPDEKLNRLKLMVLGAGLILTGLAWAFAQAFSKSWRFYRTPLDRYLLIYVLFSSFFYLSSSNPAAALSELQRMIFSAGAFFLAVQICSGMDSAKKLNQVCVGWAGGLFLISVYGILQSLGGIGPIVVPKLDRVFGTFGNPIFFAAYLVISIPLLLALAIQSNQKFTRFFYLLTILLAGANLFLAQTRAAFLSIGISFAAFYYLWKRENQWQGLGRILKRKLMIGILGAGLLLLLFFSPVKTVLKSSHLFSFSQTHTLLWGSVLEMWRENPWFGTGYGTFHIEFPRYASEKLRRIWPEQNKIVNDAHNEYLQTLAETGLIGLMVFLSILIAFYYWSHRFFRAKGAAAPQTDAPRVLAIGFVCGVTALLIQNFFSVDMRFIVSSAYLFLAMGLLFSLWSTKKEIAWPQGKLSRWVKGGWILFFIFLSGLLGIERSPWAIYLGGIYQLRKEAQGHWVWKQTPASGPGLLPALLRPYRSQKALAQEVGFFDEKLLNASKTIADLEKLAAQYPNVAKYWEKLGYALAKEMQINDAAGKKVIDVLNTQKAMAAFEKAYQLEPSNAGPPNNLGNIYYTLNRRREAIEWWQRAIAANPQSIDARVNLGIAYYYEGKVREAAEQFREVLKKDPKNERAIVMLRHMVE